MWSHYCNKHQGYVLGFDEEHDFFKGYGERPHHPIKLNRVIYSKMRVKLGSKIGQEEFFEYRHRKSLDWAYEEEVRMIRPLSCCQKKSESLHVVEYPNEALKQVIFGFCCDRQIVDEIQDCLKESQVEYLRAVPSSVSFDMELMPEEEFFRDQDSYLIASRDKLKPFIDRLRSELGQP